jgi:hypothetical protein
VEAFTTTLYLVFLKGVPFKVRYGAQKRRMVHGRFLKKEKKASRPWGHHRRRQRRRHVRGFFHARAVFVGSRILANDV